MLEATEGRLALVGESPRADARIAERYDFARVDLADHFGPDRIEGHRL